MEFEPPLGETFRAYKTATDELVQWLASTARATGSVEDLFKKGTPAAPRSFLDKLKNNRTMALSFVQKMKGKKRVHKKPTDTTASPQTIEISYKTLSRLGKAIGNAKGIEVPYNVLVVLKGIIHARKGFAT